MFQDLGEGFHGCLLFISFMVNTCPWLGAFCSCFVSFHFPSDTHTFSIDLFIYPRLCILAVCHVNLFLFPGNPHLVSERSTVATATAAAAGGRAVWMEVFSI